MSHTCTATHDDAHDKLVLELSRAVLDGFQKSAASLNLCEGMSHGTLLETLLEEMARHIADPTEFVRLVTTALALAAGVQITTATVHLLSKAEVALMREALETGKAGFKVVETPEEAAADDTVH